MELSKLLVWLRYEVIQGTVRRDIGKVTNDTRKIEAGDLFVCIKGYKTDGHNLAHKAIRKGAVAIVSERDTAKIQTQVPKDITIIKVDDTRHALAMLSAAYYRYPANDLKIIGITGTKGKSTTACMIHQILNRFGHKTGLIGTIRVDTGKRIYENCNTTPDATDIQRYLSEMRDSGCEYAVMEVSSQGLKHSRVAGISFEVGVFTNLEHDHIGPNEHADFAEYLACKQMLFKRCRVGIGNADDKYSSKMFENTAYPKISYGITCTEADFKAEKLEKIVKVDSLGIRYIIKENSSEKEEITLSIPGRFNVYNSLAAIAVLRYLGLSYPQIVEGMKMVKIPGRMEQVGGYKNCMLYIDYAHNASSLQNVLLTFREYQMRRVVLVFGCGGNRSRNRRFSMGEVAGKYADLTIITTDNPREESPDAIIKDIERGIKKTKGSYIVIADRKKAIRYAVTNRQPGDVILIAGKGHETYQEIGGIRYQMDDRELVRDI